MKITGSITMQKSCCFPALCLLLFTAAECFSGDNDHILAIHGRRSGKPRFIYSHANTIEKSLDLKRQMMPEHNFHSPSSLIGSKRVPAIYVKSAFFRSTHDQPLNLLASEDHDVEVENLPIPQSCVILVMLKMDVNKLNTTLLRKFRQGVAAALGLMPQQVHINRLNGKKNCVELFISPLNKKIGVPEALPSAEVLRSLNLHTLHQRLSHFGITEVSPEYGRAMTNHRSVLDHFSQMYHLRPKEQVMVTFCYHGSIAVVNIQCSKMSLIYAWGHISKGTYERMKNVLHGQHEADKIWTKEGLYTIVIFLSTFVIIVTFLMVLYRLKEKVQFSLKQDKKNQEIHLSPFSVQPTQSEAKHPSSMVHPDIPKAINVIVDPQCPGTFETKLSVTAGPSPFKMKPVGLQERRGSNVSLTLDMSGLGIVEPFTVAPTSREKVAIEYLQTASRVLTREQLHEVVKSPHLLHTEFMEIPMNFMDPKEIDIPSHGTKNRYKTILPNPVSRVMLKPKNGNDALSTYINANFIRGYGGAERTFIATQGPMINTVNDFWQMVFQEDVPVIVMITKLKEKNEKCVLYWPEKRGIYGNVEVLVNSVSENASYTVRQLTLKQGSQTRTVKHYWYTSWPDHKTPDSAQPLLQLMLEVEEDRKSFVGRGPVVVHCSAGIGRTGCFIATSIGCCQLKEEGVVDVLSIVCQLRMDRGGMVQTSEQYQFVHHALSLYESRLSAEVVL